MFNYAPFLNKLTSLGVFEKIGKIHEIIPNLDQKLHADFIQDLIKTIDHAEKIRSIMLAENGLENISEKEFTNTISSFTEFLAQHNMAELAMHFLIKSIDLYPEKTILYAKLSNILLTMNLVDDAAIALREATMRDPDIAEYWLIAANIMSKQGEFQSAIKCLEQVFELDSLNIQAKRFLARIYCQLNLYDQADMLLDGILEEHSHDVDAIYEKGLINLRHGNLKGFKEFEKRDECTDFKTHAYPQLQADKKWSGESLFDKKILVVDDLDPTYLYLYTSLFEGLIQESAFCLIEVNEDTLSIFARSFPKTGFILTDKIEINNKMYHFFRQEILTEYDCWVRLGDLAQYRLDEYSKKLTVPLLKPAPHRIEHWKNELKHLDNRLKIGINPELYIFLDPFWEKWQPLFNQSNIDFFALTHKINPDLIANLGIHPCPYSKEANSEEKSAFLSQLSCVIAPFSLETNIAALLGLQVIQLTKMDEWSMLGQTQSPFFKSHIDIVPYSLLTPFDVQIPQLVEQIIEVIQKNGSSPDR